MPISDATISTCPRYRAKYVSILTLRILVLMCLYRPNHPKNVYVGFLFSVSLRIHFPLKARDNVKFHRQDGQVPEPESSVQINEAGI